MWARERERKPPPVSPASCNGGCTSGPPDPAQVDSYIAIHPDNSATIFAGYVELGQGGPTALRQVAAEELDLDLDQVRDVRADTFVSTNGFTAASRTAGIGAAELRAAAAEARRVLVSLASERLKVPASDLAVTKGVVSVRANPQRSVSYAELLGGRPFNREFEAMSYQGGIELPRKRPDNAVPKRRDDYRVVGTRVPRPDVSEKIRGTYEYVQHVRLPGMLHGRVSGREGRAPTFSATQRWWRSTKRRCGTSRAFKLCGGATSSAWWRRGSGMRFVPRGN